MTAATTAYTLRAATEADLPAIKRLIHEVGINPMSLDWHRFLVIADENGRVLACGQVKPHNDGTRELASIAVVPDWRKQRLASTIIRALQDQYGQTLWLTCMDNLVGFYEPFGFVRIANPKEMSRHYRRLDRFATLFLTFSRKPGKLAVMRW